jgi:outer membrane autotransporter protein
MAGEPWSEAAGTGSGIWGRATGLMTHASEDTSTSGSSFDQESFRFDFGGEVISSEKEKGRVVLGLSGHYVSANTDVNSGFGNGSIGTDGAGIGTSLTWLGDDGFYVDGQLQFSWYDSDLNSSVDGSIIRGHGANGHVLSVEAGQRFALNNGMTLTPQGQLGWSSFDFAGFNGSRGESVSLEDGGTFQARVGFDLDFLKADLSAPERTDLYLTANLIGDLSEDTSVDVEGTTLGYDREDVRFNLGFGGQQSWDGGRTSLYGELGATTGVKDFGESYTWGGNVGVRINF